MNASTPLLTAAQVALAIGGTAAGRYVFDWSLLVSLLFGVALSYPLTALAVAVGRALADQRSL